MNTAPAYVASDTHLEGDESERARAFRSWLAWAAGRASSIVINGDLFDFWFEYGSVIPRGHSRTLGLLADIVDAGIPLHLTGGNHDWWGGSFLTQEIGVRFHTGPVRLELAGHACLVAHGDGLGAGDLGYRLLRGTLRSRPARWAFRWLHPDLGAALARRVTRTPTRMDGADEGNPRRIEELEVWARERLLEAEELDAVLLGHTHHPVRMEVASGRFYLNSGDWLQHRSYVVLPRGEAPRLESWEGEPVEGGALTTPVEPRR